MQLLTPTQAIPATQPCAKLHGAWSLPSPGTPLQAQPPVTTPVTPPLGPDNTGGDQIPAKQPNNTVTPAPEARNWWEFWLPRPATPPDGPGITIAQGATDPKTLPNPTPVVGTNGLELESNPKHTLGPEYDRTAGIEPRNSLELFNNSVPDPDSVKKRYTVDNDGNIYRFSYNNSGQWHWSGSTGDSVNPLRPSNIDVTIRDYQEVMLGPVVLKGRLINRDLRENKVKK